jgi:hypothetical protein
MTYDDWKATDATGDTGPQYVRCQFCDVSLTRYDDPFCSRECEHKELLRLRQEEEDHG